MAVTKLKEVSGVAKNNDGTCADLPRELANTLNAELMDALTLIHAAASEVEGCRDAREGLSDGITSPSSRATALLHMARVKMIDTIHQMAPYV